MNSTTYRPSTRQRHKDLHRLRAANRLDYRKLIPRCPVCGEWSNEVHICGCEPREGDPSPEQIAERAREARELYAAGLLPATP